MGCWWEATNLGFHQPTVVIVSDGGDFERWLGHLPERLELEGLFDLECECKRFRWSS